MVFRIIFIFTLLIGCNRKAKVSIEKLHKAVEKNHSITVKELILDGVDLNAKFGEDGDTPLTLAMKKKNLSTVKTLLDNKADINGKDDAGNTALMVAIDHNDSELVEVLLKRGADPNIINSMGESSVHRSVYTGNIEIVKHLLKYGADFLVRNAEGKDAIKLANEKVFLELIPLLGKAKEQTINSNANEQLKEEVLKNIESIKQKIEGLGVLDDVSLKRLKLLHETALDSTTSVDQTNQINDQVNVVYQEALSLQQVGESNIDYFKRINNGKVILESGLEKELSLNELMDWNERLKQSEPYKSFLRDIKLNMEKSLKESQVKLQINSSADLILNFQNRQYFEDGKSTLGEELKKVLKEIFPLFSQSLKQDYAPLEKLYSKVEILASAKGNKKLSYDRSREIFSFLFDIKENDFQTQFEILPLMRVSHTDQFKDVIVLRFDFKIHSLPKENHYQRVPASLDLLNEKAP